MISIIVPIYNSITYLPACVESILNQTTDDWELILVDDGSTDGSGLMCDTYAKQDPRIHSFHQPNCGASAARNAGLNYAQGEVVSFVDSDDWVEPEYVETIIKSMDSVEELIFPIRTIYPDGTTHQSPLPIGVYHGRDEIEEVIAIMHSDRDEDTFGWTANKAHRKSILTHYQIRFPENLNYYEDEVFALQYYKQIKSLRIIDKPLYNYRYSEQGLTNRKHTAECYETAAKLLFENLQGYKHPELIKGFCQQIYDFHIQAEAQENSKKEKVQRMLSSRKFYRQQKALRFSELSRKRQLYYYLPQILSKKIFLMFN